MVKTPPAPTTDKLLTDEEREAVRRLEAKLKPLLAARRRSPDAGRCAWSQSPA